MTSDIALRQDFVSAAQQMLDAAREAAARGLADQASSYCYAASHCATALRDLDDARARAMESAGTRS